VSTSRSGRTRRRRLLHPLAVTIGLAGLGGFAAVSAAAAERDMATAGAALLLAGVAGAAAGFANSGST